MANFNKVVIRNVTEQKHNIHLAVHPFHFGNIHMMMGKGFYTNHDGTELTEWQKKLSDSLWDKIPGISTLFFNNGCITIQHQGIFDDEDIVTVATEIINPYLKENLVLLELEGN